MVQYAGTLRFELDDDRDTEYNESADLTYKLYTEEDNDEILPIEEFVDYCRCFALALGFHPNTVEVAFGRGEIND